jgi:hypothetical protein
MNRDDILDRGTARAVFAWLSVATLGCASHRTSATPGALVIQEQGGFAVGGTVVTAPGVFDPIAQGAYSPTPDPRGQTLHGDHAYVFYQVPVNARRLPLVFWHGHGQSARTWETTPDGRAGFQNIFLRRGYPVYLLDQPRRGRAARSTAAVDIPATPDEQLYFGIFRLGVWPALYPGVQFSSDSSALDQFFRQMVPNTGPYDVNVNTSAVAALFERIGPGILDRDLLWRQHPGAADHESCSGAVARVPRHCKAMARCREPSRRRRHSGRIAGDRAARQHALPDVGLE